MRAALPLALLVLALANGPVAAQRAPRGTGDSLEVSLRMVLPGGDPIQGQFSYWIARPPVAGPSDEARATWRVEVVIDARLAPNARGAGAPGTVALHAPDLNAAEQRAATAAMRVPVPVAITHVSILGAEEEAAASPAAGDMTAPRAPLNLDPPGPRSVVLVPNRPRIPADDRVHARTIRYAAPGRLVEGDTVWVVVSDAGTRRWVQPAILRRTAAPAAAVATPGAALRTDVPVVFAVGQHPGDARSLPPGFSTTIAPVSFRVQAAQVGQAGVRTADAAMIAEVREHGIMALDVAMPRSGTVTVRVVDLSGRQVAVIGPEQLGDGYWVLRWDGRRADGSAVVPGVYLAITEALGARVVSRLIVTR